MFDFLLHIDLQNWELSLSQQTLTTVAKATVMLLAHSGSLLSLGLETTKQPSVSFEYYLFENPTNI